MKKLTLGIALISVAAMLFFAFGSLDLATPAYAADVYCESRFRVCNLGEQCINLGGCSCLGSSIASGEFCNLGTFNGTTFHAGQTTTGYKSNSIHFGSCTDVENYTGIKFYADATNFWRSPIGFEYSTCSIDAPGTYCESRFGVCNIQEWCNNTSGCLCQGSSLAYTQQCHFSCPAATEIVNSHTYSVPALWYGSSTQLTTGVSISNGTINYTQSFMCSGGTLSATGSEGSGVMCNASYNVNGNSCVYAGGGGGGGGSSYTPTCTPADIVCLSGTFQKKSGVSCQGGDLAQSCTIGSGVVTTGTIETGTLPIGNIFGSPYGTELNNAYLWAYAYGITTMDTIQKAKVKDTLLRSHMAKMISNFAITLGGLTPDTGASCIFDDISSQSIEMKLYIKLACQLGLMGVDIDNFHPNDEITRAQFGTVLSRVICGTRYNGGDNYYTLHLNALKQAGIMTQISNPNMKEIRGYVMLIMQRTYKGDFLSITY